MIKRPGYRGLVRIIFVVFFISSIGRVASAAQNNYLERFQNFFVSFEDDITRYGQTPWREGLRANGVDPIVYFHKDQPGNALKGTAGFDVNIDGLKPWIEDKVRIEGTFSYGDSHFRIPQKQADANKPDTIDLITAQPDLPLTSGCILFPDAMDTVFSFNQIMREGDTLIYFPHRIASHIFEPFIGMAWASVDRGYLTSFLYTADPTLFSIDLNEKTKTRYLGVETGATLNLAVTQDFKVYLEGAYYLYHAHTQFSGQQDFLFSGVQAGSGPYTVDQTKKLTTYRVRLKTGLGYDFKLIQADVSWQWDYWDYAPEIVNPLLGSEAAGSFDPAAYITGNAVRDWSINLKLSKKF